MDTNLHIRLNKELKESFQEIAKGNNTDPSSLVRDWIGNYVAEHRKTDEDSARVIFGRIPIAQALGGRDHVTKEFR